MKVDLRSSNTASSLIVDQSQSGVAIMSEIMEARAQERCRGRGFGWMESGSGQVCYRCLSS